ncbi:hypothetical protein AURDEDRAFT_170616 [Auricularia subglabra TFB-10046 SS5]|nr:hypothetical protein AURDEDRAFT_170616 [Auricularia subglabra TFB-10046 SS5]
MSRITDLDLQCWDAYMSSASGGLLRGNDTWTRLLRAFADPAPRLASLRLRYVVCDSFSRFLSIEPINIDYPLFGGVAPYLWRCRLDSVRLPPITECGAFRDVTTFSYSTYTEIAPSVIEVIMGAMPRLEVLELGPFEISSEPDNYENRPNVPPHPSLRVLMCRFIRLRLYRLLSMLPCEQLQELWLCIRRASAYEDLAKLYPDTVGVRLCLMPSGGLAGNIESGIISPAPQTFFSLETYMRLHEILSPFASITWLSIHGHLINNSIVGAPPRLLLLEHLCVRLAEPHEYLEYWSELPYPAGQSSGFLIGDHEDPPWELPALRELHISAVHDDDPSCTQPVSIALDDVAQWIRHGLTFGPSGVKLGATVLYGIWVADWDFCAGWNALMEVTESIQLEDKPDPWYMPIDDMLYETRSASLFSV